MDWMGTPSMTIRPAAASIIRNRERVIEDFPAPVRPTIPTYKIRVKIAYIGLHHAFVCRNNVKHYEN